MVSKEIICLYERYCIWCKGNNSQVAYVPNMWVKTKPMVVPSIHCCMKNKMDIFTMFLKSSIFLVALTQMVTWSMRYWIHALTGSSFQWSVRSLDGRCHIFIDYVSLGED